jgi:hypothetical protein
MVNERLMRSLTYPRSSEDRVPNLSTIHECGRGLTIELDQPVRRSPRDGVRMITWTICELRESGQRMTRLRESNDSYVVVCVRNKFTVSNRILGLAAADRCW